MSFPVARSRRLFAVGALAVLGGLSISACSSDPSPKRVALDMVETLDDLSDSERQCMTDKIEEDYTAEEIEAMGANNENFDFSQPAASDGDNAADLNAFIDDLQSCHQD